MEDDPRFEDVLPLETPVGASVGEVIEPEPHVPEPAPPRRRSWRTWFRPSARYEERLRALDEAIAAHPQAAANYVLRGDLLLKLDRPAEAQADYQRALEFAARAVESEDWGVVAQVVQDRALAGLREAFNRIPQQGAL